MAAINGRKKRTAIVTIRINHILGVFGKKMLKQLLNLL